MISLILSAVALSALALSEPLPSTTLAQLELGTFLENIAVRLNGDLLVTQLWPSAAIYTIRDPSDGHNSLEELISIPSIQSIYGLTQVPPRRQGTETFIFVGGNSTTPGATIPGSFGAWAIDFEPSRDSIKVRKISAMSSQSKFLKGVTAIPGVSDAVLVADSALGLIGRLDLTTGIFDTSAFRYPSEMDPVKGARLPIGVNGIQIHDGYLYWTNSFQASIYRIAITPAGFPAKRARPELVADLSEGVNFLDDFSFDVHGNIYVATNLDNSVVFVDAKSGNWKTVVGGIGEMTVAGSTSVAFGRGRDDTEILYVSTSGAIANPVNGTEVEGAKVVAVDTGA
ncbi:hypothetical protein FALBO_14221 [Fusarium albosuccineum]|uniref:SMP-30/Gluconolactonase/LRE-like region domain-containing protein n=1 Tax=Fusarium albosuccineum TaxID=1237068 RepID=A0A8H4P7I3_9HYPO|nr:hypothetical protein FALBO_14221 [Fusarium albosuccineum]